MDEAAEEIKEKAEKGKEREAASISTP